MPCSCRRPISSASCPLGWGPIRQNCAVGIAITGLSGTTSGAWQYQLAGSTTWNNIGSVSASQALLLSAEDLIRFVPDKESFLGTVSLTAHAWDGRTGSHGSKTHMQGSGFSAGTLTATCLVNTVPALSD